MKYLAPMARAKRADCVRLVEALRTLRPSTRDVEALYAAWLAGDAEARALVVTQPAVVLRAREQRRSDQAPAQTPGGQLVKDFGTLVGVSRRARTKIVQGLLGHLAPTEVRQARRIARQARWECDALFRRAASWLETTSATSPGDAPTPSGVCSTQHAEQEPVDAR
jgi:hypothetical protein